MNRQLRQGATDYLALRRELGFKLAGYDNLLADFIGHLECSGAQTITAEAAVTWATAPTRASSSYRSSRLSAIRGFARYLHGVDPSVQVPPADLLVSQRQRHTPNLFSTADMVALVAAAGQLTPALRGATYETIFGLLATTGMRVGEALGLDRRDVDLRAGMVEINDAKFRKNRRLPLHPSTVAALRRYAATRDRLCPKIKAPSFFVSGRGTRVLYVCVNGVFRKLVAQLALEAQPGAGPRRIHDLRHSFAVATVRDWHQAGAEPGGKLPVLSAYLGHSDPAYTYVYLHASPELLAVAAERLQRWEEGQR